LGAVAQVDVNDRRFSCAPALDAVRIAGMDSILVVIFLVLVVVYRLFILIAADTTNVVQRSIPRGG
jgi:hypothetical protein